MTLDQRTDFAGVELDDSRPAVIDQNGCTISRAELAVRAEEFGSRLGDTRRLVFLEAAQTADALAAYIACRQGRHPVLLYGSNDRDRIAPLVERYGPNAMITATREKSRITWLCRDEIELHAELGVLLSTSGSSGSPKLVKLSHANLDSNARAIASYLGLDSSERALLALRFN